MRRCVRQREPTGQSRVDRHESATAPQSPSCRHVAAPLLSSLPCRPSRMYPRCFPRASVKLPSATSSSLSSCRPSPFRIIHCPALAKELTITCPQLDDGAAVHFVNMRIKTKTVTCLIVPPVLCAPDGQRTRKGKRQRPAARARTADGRREKAETRGYRSHATSLYRCYAEACCGRVRRLSRRAGKSLVYAISCLIKVGMRSVRVPLPPWGW